MKDKKMPAHAYRFVAAGAMGGCTLLLTYTQQDSCFIKASAALTFLCVADGSRTLNQELRLGKAFGLPFFQKHFLPKSFTTLQPATANAQPTKKINI